MLEQKDLQAIREIIKEEIAESEDRMDVKLAKSENLTLEEMERTRNILEKRIDKIQRNLDELNQYYRITKLENDNTALLLKMIDELSRRIEELENKKVGKFTQEELEAMGKALGAQYKSGFYFPDGNKVE